MPLRNIALAALLASEAAAQPVPSLWGALDPGPHGVGFRVVHTVDHSRSYWPPVDWQGRVSERRGRPIQFQVWYPAERSRAAPVSFGRYIHLKATALGDSAPGPDALRDAEASITGPLRPYVPNGQVTDAVMRMVLARPTAAVENAAPAAGAFPVVVTLTPNPALEQSARWEYLASHGYVVIGVSFAGSGPAHHGRGEWTPAGMEAMGLDFGYAAAFAATLPFADTRRLAAAGAFTAAGVLYQMRALGLSALASLEGSLPPGLEGMPGWEAARMRIPVLSVASREGSTNEGTLAPFRYADRTLVQLGQVSHALTYQFPRLADTTRATALSAADAITVWTRWFLDAHLRGDSLAARRVRALERDTVAVRFGAAVRRLEALPPVPTNAEFLALLREKRVDEARAQFAAARAREPGVQLFTEEEATMQARFAFFGDRDARGVAMMELVAEAYPESWRIRELLGDAMGIVGRGEEARRAFAAAVERAERDAALAGAEREAVLGRLRGKAGR